MVSRVFVLAENDRAALERLGAALILQWCEVPEPLRESLVQQAIALDWTSDPEAVARHIRRMVRAQDDVAAPAAVAVGSDRLG